MNKPLVRLAGLFVVLAAVALLFSCGSPQPPPQNQNQNGTNVNVAFVVPDPSCDASTLTQRRTDVEGALKTLIGNDKQLAGHIEVKVDIVNNMYLQAVITGYAGGQDELEDLAKIVRKVMHKNDCVRKVFFVNTTGSVPPPGNANATAGAQIVGFLWTACEWPKVVCPDGSCGEGCDMASNTNANTTGNTNTMTNTNANSNANRANVTPSNANGR